jgi:hypothetical protein
MQYKINMPSWGEVDQDAHYKCARFAEHLLFLPILSLIGNRQQKQNNMENLSTQLRTTPTFPANLVAQLQHLSKNRHEKFVKLTFYQCFYDIGSKTIPNPRPPRGYCITNCLKFS